MPGYKNKSKEITCLCINQAVRLLAVCKAIFLHLKDDNDANHDNGTSNNSYDAVVLTDKVDHGNDEGNATTTKVNNKN